MEDIGLYFYLFIFYFVLSLSGFDIRIILTSQNELKVFFPLLYSRRDCVKSVLVLLEMFGRFIQ